MKIKIFSLVLIALLAVSAIGTVSALDVNVHIQKSGCWGGSKTYDYNSGAYNYHFDNLWILGWAPTVSATELTIYRNENNPDDYKIDYTRQAYKRGFKVGSPQDLKIHLDESKLYMLECGSVLFFINPSAIQDSSIPLVIDASGSLCHNVHLGVNGVKYEYDGSISSGLIMTTPIPTAPSHPNVNIKPI
jgi:hypothetical protein